jgi:hypothetical protein
MWTTLRGTTLALLKEAEANRTIQENSYELISFFDYKLHEQCVPIEVSMIKTLLSDNEILKSLWAAATATRLSPQATGRLTRFVETMRVSGVPLPLAEWWAENIRIMEGGSALTPAADPPT